MSDTDTKSTAEQSAEDRRALSTELEGLEGLVYRIAAAQEAGGMHASALAVVCEAIYLARQVMAQDAVHDHDVDNLISAVEELELKGMEWQVNAVQTQVWPLLPERLQPDSGPTRKAMEFALHEWLTQSEVEGKSPKQLAEAFAEFCEVAQKPEKPARRRGKSED
jgi:hypothetical protein